MHTVFQGKSGMITTAHGLRIACLGGIYDPSIYFSTDAPLVRHLHSLLFLLPVVSMISQGFLSPHFSAHTVERLLSNAMSKDSKQDYKKLAAIQSSAAASQFVDILLTHAWPQFVSQFSSVPLPQPDISLFCAPPLDDVVRRLRPRYHFASGGGHPSQFWERE